MKMLKITILTVLALNLVFTLDAFAKRRNETPEAIYDFEADEPINGLAVGNRGKLYFEVETDTVNDDGTTTTTYALWLSDGEDAEEIYAFDEGSIPLNFVSNRGKLYFILQTTTTTTNDDGTTTITVTEALWVSDGTEDGTEEVIALDASVSVVTALTSYRGKVYFGATETVTNDDGTTTDYDSLWVSDGTEDDTEAFFTFEADQALVTNITANKRNLYFGIQTTTANDDGTTTISDSLWITDGTEDETETLFDFEADTYFSSNLTSTKGKLFFFIFTLTTNDDGTNTTTDYLWRSDGDEETEAIYEFDSTVVPVNYRIITTKGKLFFSATETITNDDGSTTTTDSLWRSDGDEETEAVYDFESNQTFDSNIITTKGKLFFIIENVVTNDDGTTTTTYQFWTSDSDGEAEVIDDSYESTQYLYNIGTSRGMVFFFIDNTVTADDGTVSHTYELYMYK